MGAKLLAPGRKQGRKLWAALIRQVYGIDPLSCPKCGAELKIIAFIEGSQMAVVEKIPISGGCRTGCGKRNPIEDRRRFKGGPQAEMVKRRRESGASSNIGETLRQLRMLSFVCKL